MQCAICGTDGAEYDDPLHPARPRADCAVSAGGARARADTGAALSDPTMQQTTLTDDTRTDEPTNTTAGMTDRERSANARTMLAPPDQRGGDGCCPWCLAAAETFEHHGDSARCGYCDASIPLGVDWYERGEKIVL